MVSRAVVIVLLITALLLSSTAVYITVTKFGDASVTGSFNQASVGVYVKPEKKANVGVTVLPPEEKKGIEK